MCVAKSHDGNWYRATIINVEESQAKVQFPDYGNTEVVAKESIKKLDTKFYEPCVLALVASLGLIALQEDALAKLKEWTDEKEVQVTLAFGSDGWLASLHLDGVDLAMKLVNEKYATPRVTSAEEEEKVEAPSAEPISLPEGCTQVYISHIDTPGHFWLQMLDKIDKIEEIQSELQANANTYTDIENRELGTLCIAKYLADDQWYRAEILDSDSDITTVRFIDYGNTDVLDNQPGLIKALPDHLKEIERYAVKSSVNAVPTGTGEWSEPASDYFTQLVGDISAPVDALIVLKDVTTYVDIFVSGQNITDKLVSEGHAIRSEDNDCGDLPSCFASHVNSPSEFWIQLETAAPELQAMEAAMIDAENFPELIEKEEGVICAAKYPEDGAWYRAQVIVDGSEGTEVLFMDYGNASIANELRSLPEELKIKPALSRKCALQKPRDIKWSRKSEIRFNELAAEGATIFNVQFIASGDISIVELYLEGKSVTEELVALCEELPNERPTPVGQDLLSNGKICFVNSLEEFYVQLEDSTSDLDKVTEKMNYSPEFETATELKVGSISAAFWPEDQQWYRAKILEFCDIGYHVQFIDYGNKAKCEEFRQLPEDLAIIEPLAKCCRLAGTFGDHSLKEIGKDKLDELTIENTTFQIEFLDTTKEPILVKLLVDDKDFITCIKNDTTVSDEVAGDIDLIENVASEQTDLNTSQHDLDVSLDSNHTVIENKCFNDKSDEIGEEEEKDICANKPEENVSTDSLCESLKTPECDESKESIYTDTGYISGELSPSVASSEIISTVETDKVAKDIEETSNTKLQFIENNLERKENLTKTIEKISESKERLPEIDNVSEKESKTIKEVTEKSTESTTKTTKISESKEKLPEIDNLSEKDTKTIDEVTEKSTESTEKTSIAPTGTVEKVADSREKLLETVETKVENQPTEKVAEVSEVTT